jgi:hypothetical protein
MAVVTPNWAMDKRSQTNSYSTLQSPETKKKKKNQLTTGLLAMARGASAGCGSAHSRVGMGTI